MTPEMNLAEIFAIHNPLDKECLKEVEQAASLARVPKRSVLLRQGDVCRHFYFNRSGLMRVAHIDDGTEDTVCFGTSGDVFTSLQSYFDGSPSIFSLVALYDSEVYSISYEDLDRLSSGFPDLVLWMRNTLPQLHQPAQRAYARRACEIRGPISENRPRIPLTHTPPHRGQMKPALHSRQKSRTIDYGAALVLLQSHPSA